MKGDGFTIVELIIFLAMTGLLLTMAMVGSGNLARQTRFSDSINSFHSMMQREFEEVANGVNTRQDTEAGCSGGSPRPGTDSCLLLGKVISFNHAGGTTATVRYVTDTPPYLTTGTPENQILLSQPRVTTTGERAYELAWGAEFQIASRRSVPTAPDVLLKPGSSRAVINNVAFLRSPTSSRIITYYFYSDSQTAPSVESNLRQATVDWINRSTNVDAYICITNRQEWIAASAPVAAIALGIGQGSVAIDTKFNPTRSSVADAECNQ